MVLLKYTKNKLWLIENTKEQDLLNYIPSKINMFILLTSVNCTRFVQKHFKLYQ